MLQYLVCSQCASVAKCPPFPCFITGIEVLLHATNPITWAQIFEWYWRLSGKIVRIRQEMCSTTSFERKSLVIVALQNFVGYFYFNQSFEKDLIPSFFGCENELTVPSYSTHIDTSLCKDSIIARTEAGLLNVHHLTSILKGPPYSWNKALSEVNWRSRHLVNVRAKLHSRHVFPCILNTVC
jgi:hypothetical protein